MKDQKRWRTELSIIATLLHALGMFATIIPVIEWSQQPELTNTQMTLKYWPCTVAGIALYSLGMYAWKSR